MMHSKTPILGFDSTVIEAIEYFKSHATDFALVQASKDRVQGVLTEGILARIYLRYRAHPERETLILYREMFEPVQLINAHEPFEEVVKKVITAVGNRAFVMNQNSEVIGYITAKDILPHFQKSAPQKEKEGPTATSGIHSDLYLYESFFTQSPFMMHSVNKEGVIQMANEVLHRVLGYEYGELIGKSVYEIYPKAAHGKVKESLSQIIYKGFNKVVRGSMVTKTGEEFETEMVSRALMDAMDIPVGTITISRPVDMQLLIERLPNN